MKIDLYFVFLRFCVFIVKKIDIQTDKSQSTCALPLILDADNPHVEQYLKALKAVSNAFDETLFVVDFKRRCFRFVSDRGIFLCGYTPEEVLKMGIKGEDAADIIGIEHQNIRNILTPLFERLDVSNTLQAHIFLQNPNFFEFYYE